jgi:hypothetical protein
VADYAQSGNRWTMILARLPQHGGQDFYERAPYELCRFNVDTDPSAKPVIIPLGQNEISGPVGTADTWVNRPSAKIYEKIWIVDQIPWTEKHRFSGVF